MSLFVLIHEKVYWLSNTKLSSYFKCKLFSSRNNNNHSWISLNKFLNNFSYIIIEKGWVFKIILSMISMKNKCKIYWQDLFLVPKASQKDKFPHKNISFCTSRFASQNIWWRKLEPEAQYRIHTKYSPIIKPANKLWAAVISVLIIT